MQVVAKNQSQESKSITDSSKLCLENACGLFREICILAEKGVSKELRFKSLTSSQTDWLCLEVVDTCLRCHSSLFDRYLPLAKVLQDTACVMVLNKLQTLINTTGIKKDLVFGLSVRVMRVTAAILTVQNTTAGLGKEICRVMAMLTQMTCGEYPLFHRTLALEVIYTFSSREGFANRVNELHSNRDGAAGDAVDNGVVGLIHSLERVIHRSLGVSRLPMASASAIALAKSTLETLATGTDEMPTIRILQILGNEPAIGLATESACVDLALASLSNIVAALGELCGIPCVPFDDECPRQLANKPICNLDVLVLNVQVVRDIIDAAWEPILEALQTVMVSVLAPCILQRVLRAYTNFTQTCGALQLVGPRDRALAPLCKYAVPSPTQEGSMAPLYAHHILMCRALLSLVLALGGVLGETWTVVLEALQRLDSALVDRGYIPNPHSQSPQKNVTSKGEFPEIGNPNPSKSWSQSRLESELLCLRQMLDSLFEQTSSLDESTAIQLMSALCRVSLSSISDARPDILPTSAGGKGERMFGVEKLVEIVKHNFFRVGRLWEPAVSQLIQLGIHPRRSVRQYGMSNITQLVILSLKSRVGVERENSVNVSDGKTAKCRLSADFEGVNEQEFDMERRLLAVYEELYRSQFVDTKNYVLDGLYTVLQSCGEQVGPAWPMILALLKGVAQDKEAQQQDKEAQQVKRAFMCIQLIRNDLLSALPVDCLQLFLTTIGAFGLQDSDLNISLTAITLLWNIADFFGRERPALLAAFAVVGVLSPPQSPTNGSAVEERETRDKGSLSCRREVHNVDQLWLVLYQQLRYLAVDSRLEVRNSALRTLFTALETHGNVLENDSWRQVVEELLLRVLDDVEQSALQSASDTPVERPLGPATVSGGDGTRGAQQMMLIHHSRNTLSKQWHVSWETAFQGVIRMIMTYFKKVCELERHEEVWATLMEHLCSCILRGSDQVVISGMASLKELLCSTTGGSSGPQCMCRFPQVFWKRFWETIYRATLATCATSGYSVKALKGILTELGNILELPSVSLSGFVDKETVQIYTVLLDNVICASFTINSGSTAISTLIDAAFSGFSVVARLIKAQPESVEDSLWLATFNIILQHLPGKQNRYSWWPEHIRCEIESDFSTDFLDGKSEGRFVGPIANTDLNCKLLLLMSTLFESETPQPVKSLLLEQISVKIIATMCTARYYEPRRDLWRRAAEVWMQTMKAGIPALNECGRLSAADKDRVWRGFAQGLTSFMLPDDSQVVAEARESVDEAQRSEQVDMSLVGFVVQNLLNCAPSPDIQINLLEIVDGGAAALQRMPTISLSESPVSFRFHLAEQSLDLLFSLTVGPNSGSSELSTSSLSLARLAAPVLIRRCSSILESFVKDEAEAASCPLPRARTDQAVRTARRLEHLQLNPAICQQLFESRTSSEVSGTKLWGRSGRRGHLILLYGPLCRAIGASNTALRESVRGSLEIVGWELSIGNCDWSAVIGRSGTAPFGYTEHNVKPQES